MKQKSEISNPTILAAIAGAAAIISANPDYAGPDLLGLNKKAIV